MLHCSANNDGSIMHIYVRTLYVCISLPLNLVFVHYWPRAGPIEVDGSGTGCSGAHIHHWSYTYRGKKVASILTTDVLPLLCMDICINMISMCKSAS